MTMTETKATTTTGRTEQGRRWRGHGGDEEVDGGEKEENDDDDVRMPT
jgi:hypothetical protein